MTVERFSGVLPRDLVQQYGEHRARLIHYLDRGTTGTYKDGVIRYVRGIELQELALRAGYTDLALAGINGTGVTDLEPDRRSPQKPEERISICLHASNRYGFEPNQYYDAVDELSRIARSTSPDYPEGEDPLLRSVLKRLDQFETAKARLLKTGYGWLSFDTWNFNPDGTMHFWLNPIGGFGVKSGWYTLDDIKSWANGNPESAVFSKNHPAAEAPTQRPNFQEYWQGQLQELADAGEKKERLLQIALLSCPFPQLVEQYSNPSKT